MTTPDQFQPPSLPSPTAVTTWTSNALTLMKLLSGAGIMGATWAAYTPDKVAAIVTLALYVVSILAGVAAWIGSRWQHYQLARADRASSVASALATMTAGTPVIVVPSPTAAAPAATVAKPVSVVDVAASRAIMAAPTVSQLSPGASP